MKYLQIIRDLVSNFRNTEILKGREKNHTYGEIDSNANKLAGSLLNSKIEDIKGKKFGIT